MINVWTHIREAEEEIDSRLMMRLVEERAERRGCGGARLHD